MVYGWSTSSLDCDRWYIGRLDDVSVTQFRSYTKTIYWWRRSTSGLALYCRDCGLNFRFKHQCEFQSYPFADCRLYSQRTTCQRLHLDANRIGHFRGIGLFNWWYARQRSLNLYWYWYCVIGNHYSSVLN